MGRRIAQGLAVLCALGAFVAYLELRPSDERRITDLVHALASDAERKDVNAMASWVSERYHDERGLSREGALSALGAYLGRNAWSRVLPVNVTISEIKGERATATAQLILAQANSPLARPVSEAMRIDLDLTWERGRWRVLSAEDWQVPTASLVRSP